MLAGDLELLPLAEPANPPVAEAQEAIQLRMLVRDTYLPGVPILVRVQLEKSDRVDREIWDASAALSSDNPAVSLSTSELSLVNGMGSVLVTVDGNQPFSLIADWNGVQVTRQLDPLIDPPIQELSGTLTGDATTVSGVVHVTGDLTVPEDHLLELAPGTILLVDGVPQTPQSQLGTQIIVRGTLNAIGTEESPITITASDPQRPWSELDVQGGSVALEYVEITRAGTSPRGGHTNSGPALRLRDNGSLNMSHSSVTDIQGKIMQATSGTAVMTDVLLSRAVMGPEIEDTALEFRDSWIVEMAGVYHHNGTVDDNDGIYLHRQQAGQEIHLAGGVIAYVQDDAIDTLGSDVLIEDFYVRNADDKAVSVFNGEVTIAQCLFTDADIGVETKGSGASRPRTNIDRTTIANTKLGISARDKDAPDPDVVITYNITNSIIHVRSGGDPVRTDYDPVDLHINYTSLAEPWDYAGSGDGNLDAQPLFVDLAANNYHLDPSSPAIDAGDPAAPSDPDGTRSDLGYFPFWQQPGDFNRDGRVDASDIDLLAQSIRESTTTPAMDLDRSGQVDWQDFDYLIGEILQTSAGDANLDQFFDTDDLVLVLQAGEYEDPVVGNSGWASGDWNGDGDFTTNDLVLALQTGRYEQDSTIAARSIRASDLCAAFDAVWHQYSGTRRAPCAMVP